MPVRVSDADEQAGLDNALHGETAYVGADKRMQAVERGIQN